MSSHQHIFDRYESVAWIPSLIAFIGSSSPSHLIFRKNDWTRYDPTQLCRPKGLPLGAATVATFVCACAIIVPCMSQGWYVLEGPIANLGWNGDIGVSVGLRSLLLYTCRYVLFKGPSKSSV